MRKKLLVMMMVMALGAGTCLTACGGGSDETQSDATVEQDAAGVADAGADVETEVETEVEEEVVATRGTVENGMFTNETFGISFAVTDDMLVYTDEQLLQAVGVGTDVAAENMSMTAEEMEEMMSGVMYDTMMTMSDGLSNVIVAYENTQKTFLQFTEEQYITMLQNQLSQIEDIDYTFGETERVTLGGHEYAKCDFYTTQGISQTYCLRMVGDYQVSIIYTCLDGSEQLRDDFFASFVEVQ